MFLKELEFISLTCYSYFLMNLHVVHPKFNFFDARYDHFVSIVCEVDGLICYLIEVAFQTYYIK